MLGKSHVSTARAPEERCQCAGSWDTPGGTRLSRSWSRDCGGSSIAVTTAPGWRRSMVISSCVRKRAGRVRALEELLDREPGPGTCGISHTRWATHGPATRPQCPSAHRRPRGCGDRGRRAQRRDREPRGAAPGAAVARLRVRERNRYRGRRAPDRPRAGIGLRPVRCAPAGVASARGNVWTGGGQPRSARE